MVERDMEEIVPILPDKGEKTRILLVDDHPLFLRYLSHFFPRQEYQLVTASNGEEALDQARQLEPDLIVLDLDMPTLDGIETCTLLKADEATRHIPVIILTASESLEVNRKAFGAGAQATVLKSMSRERLMNLVDLTVRVKKVTDSP